MRIRSGHIRVDGLVRLKIKRHLLFLAFISQDSADEENEPVGRHSVIQLETLLSTRDGSQHRQPIDTRLDVRGRAVFLC